MLWNILIPLVVETKNPTEPSSESINEVIDIDKDGVVMKTVMTMTLQSQIKLMMLTVIPLLSEDCDDNDSNIINTNVDDADCDTFLHLKIVTTRQ